MQTHKSYRWANWTICVVPYMFDEMGSGLSLVQGMLRSMYMTLLEQHIAFKLQEW